MENKLIKAIKDTITSKSSMELIKEDTELSIDSFLTDGTLVHLLWKSR